MNRGISWINIVQALFGVGAVWLVFGMNISNAQGKDKPAGKVKVVYEKKTTIDFDGAPVGSEFRSPDGTAVKSDQNLDFDSLLAPKKDFAKELNRGARAVR